MIRSMTGYGRSEARGPDGTVVIELRSVNHRYLDVNTRLPRELASLEPVLKKRLQRHFARGRLDLTVTLNGTQAPQRKPILDLALARQYHRLLAELRDHLGVRGEADLSLIAGLRDVLSVVEVEPIPVTLRQVEAAVEQAVQQAVAMRLTEGKAIASDLARRLRLVEQALRGIEKRLPRVKAAHQARLRRMIQEIDDRGNNHRVAQELIAWADRADVSEEIQRLCSHVDQFRRMIGRTEAVGKSLDFLIQEMNREINTIGSKVDDAAVALQVVGVKSELEKIREQVQNVE